MAIQKSDTFCKDNTFLFMKSFFFTFFLIFFFLNAAGILFYINYQLFNVKCFSAKI